jgi:hypothetical protein
MISPDTRQNVTRLRARQDNFQKQIGSATSWDILALDFVDSQLQRSLRDLVMKIESRTVPGQPLFHAVDETWNQNGYIFSFFPNVDTEARAMMISLIPFLRHHYQESITKWFSQTARSRAVGADWDPDKGCVKTFEDAAVSWMMTEDGFTSFDAPMIDTAAVATRPDASNLEIAGTGLIEDQDSVGTFDPKAPAPTPSTVPPAQLISGAKANSVPPPQGTSTQSLGSSSSRSSMTESMFSRLSEIETTLKKVDNLDALMHQIAAKMGLLVAPDPPAPSTPAIPPEIHRAPPLDSLHHVSVSPSSSTVTPSQGDVRPSTHGGTSLDPTALLEIRQSPADTANAGDSSTAAGRAG